MGVFIAPPLPVVVRDGKIESDSKALFDGPVTVKFGPVISGDGLESPLKLLNELYDSFFSLPACFD